MKFPPALDPFRSIPAVVRAARASPGPLLAWWFGGIATFFVVYLVVYLPAILVFTTATAAHGGTPPVWAIVVCAGAVLALFVLLLVGQCLWLVGMETLLHDVLRTGQCSVARAWSQRRRFGVLLRATLLVFALALAAYVPLVLGVLGFAALARYDEPSPALVAGAFVLGCVWFLAILYVFLGLVFVNSAAALDECGAVEAVRRSWRAASGHRLALVWLFFVTMIAALSGLLLFCVGYVFTVALATLVPVEAYLALTRGEEYSRWWISTGVEGEPGAEHTPAASTNAT